MGVSIVIGQSMNHFSLLKLCVTQSHLSVTQSHLGVTQSHLGVTQSHLGVKRSHLGVTQSHLGVTRSHLGVTHSHHLRRMCFSQYQASYQVHRINQEWRPLKKKAI